MRELTGLGTRTANWLSDTKETLKGLPPQTLLPQSLGPSMRIHQNVLET